MARKQPDMFKNEKAPPDLSEIFDLTRDKAVRGYVERFASLLRDRDAVTEDIRELGAECKEAMFSPLEIASMKDIAKWINGDKKNAVAGKLAALRRVSNAVKLDLFSWADVHKGDTA